MNFVVFSFLMFCFLSSKDMDQVGAPANPGPAPAAATYYTYYTVFWDEQTRRLYMRHRVTGELVIPGGAQY